MRFPRPFLLFALSAALATTACSDAGQPLATEPVSGSPSTPSHLLGDLLGTEGIISRIGSFLVSPVQRTTPLAEDVSWSFVAQPGGSLSQHAASGLTIVVPSGAVSAPTTISVTALAGGAVAYKFEPHGLVFRRNVYLTQNLRGTSAGLLRLPVLTGAYFATDRLELNESGLAIVTELLAALSNPFTKTVTFPIRHFSGYIVASGRVDVGGDE